MKIPMAVEEALGHLREAFPDEPTCEAYLFGRRWPNGFVCQKCGSCDYAKLTSRAFTYQCSRCHCQTSITAGTVMHRSKLPLTVWFWAAGLIATYPKWNLVRLFQVLFDISAQSGRLLIRKFKQLIDAFNFDSRPLEGLVEVDYLEFHLRAADGSVNESVSGRVKVVVAIEIRSDQIRAAQLLDDSAKSIDAFVRCNVKAGTTLFTNGHSSYGRLIDYDVRIGKTLRRTERMLAFASNFLRKKHGLQRQDVEDALHRFGVNENEKHYCLPAFDTLIQLALDHNPTSYWDMVGRENPRKGSRTIRRKPRHRKTLTGMRQDGSGLIRTFPRSYRSPTLFAWSPSKITSPTACLTWQNRAHASISCRRF
jgi:hypothetical protein